MNKWKDLFELSGWFLFGILLGQVIRIAVEYVGGMF